MTEFYRDDWLTIYGGDVRAVLPQLPADSVDCIVTSPPYWGLRDYGTAAWDTSIDDERVGREFIRRHWEKSTAELRAELEAEAADCDHKVGRFARPGLSAKQASNNGSAGDEAGRECPKCGAIRQDAQLGLERTPEEYVANLVSVFRELRRVLKLSGTAWLNLGDSFGDKQLVGIPWRVAFALQADGWYLRSDIIWAKPNPMPESVTDRPTKAHEYLFLLTKSARYYYDADAVREAQVSDHPSGNGYKRDHRLSYRDGNGARGNDEQWQPSAAGRNLRSVWTIATRPYPGAHFAVFPPELPERCIKAGSSERGVCPDCGAPWTRVVERTPPPITGYTSKAEAARKQGRNRGASTIGQNRAWGPDDHLRRTIAWRPTCDDYTGPYPEEGRSNPAVILDPFAGSGTVGMVANRLSRRAILIDLNADYLRQQLERNAQTPLGLA